MLTDSKENKQQDSLTGSRVLIRSTFWNLLGQMAPLIAAIFAIPLLIKSLGTDRFGVLSLVWIMIGYFNIFDFGLGRALTKIVAEKLGTGDEDQIPSLVWTALFLMVAMGCFGAAVLSGMAGFIVRDVLSIPTELQSETIKATYVLAAGVPFVVARAGLAGVLQAQQRFDLVNIIQIPMGIYMFMSPLAILPFSNSLYYVTLVLVIGRVVTTFWNLMQCFHTLPSLRKTVRISRSAMKSLLSFGGWMTVSNIISPLMVQLDRFLIGALVSVAAVAYYATPYEMITKLWLIPTAIVGTLFPAFAMSFVQDPKRTSLLFNRGVKYIFLSLFPVTVIVITFSYEGIKLWLGAEFAENSSLVLQLLAIGVLVNSLAQVPFVLIQGIGRPNITAKLHVIELPIYLIAVWWMISAYGIKGAAIAWGVRCTLDAFLLFVIVRWLLPKETEILSKGSILVTIVVGAILTFSMLPMGIFYKITYLLIFMLLFMLAGWYYFFAPEERTYVRDLRIWTRLNRKASER